MLPLNKHVLVTVKGKSMIERADNLPNCDPLPVPTQLRSVCLSVFLSAGLYLSSSGCLSACLCLYFCLSLTQPLPLSQ